MCWLIDSTFRSTLHEDPSVCKSKFSKWFLMLGLTISIVIKSRHWHGNKWVFAVCNKDKYLGCHGIFNYAMGFLSDTQNCVLRMCRERFPLRPTSKETASKRSRHASRHMRHARAEMHVGIAYPRWRGKPSRHSRRMRTCNFTYLARGPYSLIPNAALHLYERYDSTD